MVPSAYRDLITKLAEKTARGQANWQTSVTEGVYVLDFKSFSLAVYYDHEPQDEDSVGFRLFDEAGKEIDSFWIFERSDQGQEGSGWYERCHAIYQGARRKALRIDEAIRIITEQLDIDGPIGSESSDEFVHEPSGEDDVPL